MADKLAQSDLVMVHFSVTDADGVEHTLLDGAAMTWQYVVGLIPTALDKAHQQAEANVMTAITAACADQIAAALAPIEQAQATVVAEIAALSE